MRIGFLMKWLKGMQQVSGHVIGEELYAESLCRELLQLKGVKSAQLYGPNYRPSSMLDVMIHLNDTMPGPYARKHILYMQNFYNKGSDVILQQLQKVGFDGYAFFSERLLDIHRQAGYSGIFLPLAADTTIFQPKAANPKYDYDVAYVGNDIKGQERTLKYIYPATQYKFGLFGNWNLFTYPYSQALAKLSQGTITREESASLYSSAKIMLNYSGQDSVRWDAMNLRFFEVLACKGFLISDKIPSAERELNGCVVFTDGDQDLIRKIDYYLTRPAERTAIAEQGYQYVVEHASVRARASQLYKYLEEIM